MKVSLLSVAFLTVLISGCGTKIEYVQADLSSKLPPQLQKHEIPSEEGLMCLTDDEYGKVIKLYKRIQTLREIVLSTRVED
jgi:hypothetical protein